MAPKPRAAATCGTSVFAAPGSAAWVQDRCSALIFRSRPGVRAGVAPSLKNRDRAWWVSEGDSASASEGNDFMTKNLLLRSACCLLGVFISTAAHSAVFNIPDGDVAALKSAMNVANANGEA